MSPLVFRLQELRLAEGWSQRDLAAKLGISNRAVSDLESGKTRRIDVDLLDRIATLFGVPVGTLFAEAP
ncbi:MAG: helix-turn-helix domain-containing protein [Phycisphaerales bacterium]|nr:helix-turn-helix domain-containing protein [Phycisphaerales bacterium]